MSEQGEMFTVTTIDIMGGESSMEMPITQEQYDAYREARQHAGKSIEQVFGDFPFTLDQREFLISGVTPEKWNEIFSDED